MRKVRAISMILILVLIAESLSLVHGWNLERPGGSIHLWKKCRAENAGTNLEAAVGLCVSPSRYDEDDSWYQNHDYVKMNISMTTNSRRGISYEYSYWPWDEWYNESSLAFSRPNVGDEWGEWFSVSPEFQYFSLYGGRYKKLYVSSNGFVSVNNANMSSPSPQFVPNSQEPNGIIAGCWTDLVIDSSSSIHVGEYDDTAGRIWFVVVWKNARHKASGKRATFEIAISNRIEWYQESKIRFNYRLVEAINDDWVYGIEDQQGVRGWLTTGDGRYQLRDFTFDLVQASNTFFLRYLTIKMLDDNLNTKLDIMDEAEDLRGYNVEFETTPPPQPDEGLGFGDVLQTGYSFLCGDFGGLIEDAVFATVNEWWRIARVQYSNAKETLIEDQRDNTYVARGARIKVATDAAEGIVDASLCVRLMWEFTESPTQRQNHTLVISANSTYDVFDREGAWLATKSVVTSVTLKMGLDNNNNFATAQTINPQTTYERLYIGKYDQSDYYKIYAGQGQKITAHAWATLPDPSAPGAVFYIRIYDPLGGWHGSSNLSSDVTFYVTTDCAGLWGVEVYKYYESYGFYSLKVVVGDESGGCPILSVFNGSNYIEEGLLNIHHSDCTDVVVYHALSTVPEVEAGRYLLRLTEHPQTHSYIDQVKLYATLSDRTMIQLPLVSATHSEYGNVLPQLLFSDDWRTEMVGANFKNGTSDSIDLKFLALPPFVRVESFTFMIEGYNPWWKT